MFGLNKRVLFVRLGIWLLSDAAAAAHTENSWVSSVRFGVVKIAL